MASLGCGFCGERLYYHGEPEGTEPVEHVFCRLDKWRKLEAENLTADHLEMEHEEFFAYAWRCWRCNTFTFFDYSLKNIGTYTPNEEFSSAPMQEPFEFGPFWNDFQWFDINERSTPTAEVFTRYPQNLWLAKNENEMRLYADEARTNCVGQFRRLTVVTPITVATMSLDAFKKMLVTYDDEIDFFYGDVGYEFIKEKLVGSKIKIVVNRDFDNPVCRYSVTVSEGENFIDDLVNTKIFPDGKSIAEAQAEVRL